MTTFFNPLGRMWASLAKKLTDDKQCETPACKDGSGSDSHSLRPPNREEIGRANWMYLHGRAEGYPESPTEKIVSNEEAWIYSFVYTYPCQHCALSFAHVCAELPPRLNSRRDYKDWWIKAHNKVNEEIGKPQFKSSS